MEINPKKNSNYQKSQPNAYLKYSGMGLMMGATIFLFTYGGLKLDQWLKFKFPLFTLVLALTGVFAALYYVIKDVSKMK